MDLKKAIAVTLTLTVLGCNDYPGHKLTDPMKLSSAPSWGKVTQTVIGGDCNIDSINDTPGLGSIEHLIPHDQNLSVKGWAAISVQNTTEPSNIALALRAKSNNETRLFVMTDSIKRPDVADSFKNPGALSSGFSAVIDLSTVRPGPYELEIFQNNHGTATVCQYTAPISIV